MNRTVDITIIGAGPAGLIAAMQLNKKGYKVQVLEKSTFPRFVIGESLLPACMDVLDELDLVEELKLKNHQKKTGATFCRGEEECEFFFENQHTDGWSWTWQVKRADFDKDLFDIACSRGIDILTGCEVTDVTCTKEVQTVVYSHNGENVTLSSKFVLDASGYGRVLPRLMNLESTSDLPNRGAIYSHITDENRTKKNGENIFVHSFNDNKDWIWVIPFNDNTSSVGVVGGLDTIESMEGEGKLLNFFQNFDDLKGRFEGQDLLIPIDSKKGYSVKAKTLHGDGFVLCGNSTEFIDPVFSSGVTFAMISGNLAAKLVDRQLTGDTVDWDTEYDLFLEKGLKVFKAFIRMWYDGTFQRIVFAKYTSDGIRKQICSVLAGYVWDETNPFISKGERVLKNLMRVIEFGEQEK
jgi:flavin-dependent dehydrogenase